MTENKLLQQLIEKVDTIGDTTIRIEKDIGYITTNVQTNKDAIKDLEVAVVGDGTDKNPGHGSRIRQIEKWMRDRIWFERLLIGVVLIEVVGLVFIYVTK